MDGGSGGIRSACRACLTPAPVEADLVIGLFGADTGKELLIQTDTPVGGKLVEGLDLKESKSKYTQDREKALKDVLNERERSRSEIIERMGEKRGVGGLSVFYEKCVNCHNCMKACPICYCKECLFDSSIFDMEAYRYLKKAESKGLYKMPNDSLLFHVTRMNHMILSCIGCGLCEQACPSGIPLMDVIIPVADEAQEHLEYRPGSSADDKAPMVVYREDEFTDVGE